LNQQFATLIEVSVVLCLLVYVYACIAMWRYDTHFKTTRGLYAYRILAVVAAGICLFVIAKAGTAVLTLSAVIALLAFPLFLFFRRTAQVRAATLEHSSSVRVGLKPDLQ
jgi:arginine:agmatine antiporter